MSLEDIIVGVISLNGGALVGKTRLQKTIYLLDLCGLESGANFEYHNFGPFSRDVATAADFVGIENRISADQSPGYHQIPYFTFKTDEGPPAHIGSIEAGNAEKFLGTMADFSAIELELAATIAFLNRDGVPVSDVDDQVTSLKPSKSTTKRLKNAHEILTKLGIELV